MHAQDQAIGRELERHVDDLLPSVAQLMRAILHAIDGHDSVAGRQVKDLDLINKIAHGANVTDQEVVEYCRKHVVPGI